MAGMLGVIVKNRSTGMPMSDVSVTIYGPGNCTDTSKTDVSGIANFDCIREGLYSISAEKGGYFIGNASATVAAGSVAVIIQLDQVRYLYFAIYYWVDDGAFRRAAETWRSQVQGASGFDQSISVVRMFEVKTEGEFMAVWEKLLQEGNKSSWKVAEGRVFSHASKGYDEDGIEFQGGTLSQREMKALPKLNWAKNGKIVLHSCNSGLTGDRGWAPAGEFANSQGVPTTGQTGFSYFSRQWGSYSETDPTSTGIYLWAYKRGKNGWNSGGYGGWRMEGRTFHPSP